MCIPFSRLLGFGVLLIAGAALAADDDAVFISGTWSMQGRVAVEDSNVRRPISGRVIVDQQDAEYRATFHLSSMVKTGQGLRRANLIGRGEGTITGRRIAGTIETQIVTASVGGTAGLLPQLPRHVSPVLENTVSGQINEDGTLSIELDYQPVEGGPLEATRTSLTGTRIDP